MCTLRGLGWQAQGPARWKDPRGDTWQPGHAHQGVEELQRELAKDIESKLWQEAAAKSWQGARSARRC